MKTTTIRQFFFGLMALSLSTWASGADVYTYDKLNRLTKILYSNGASVTYDLDPAGNILAITNVPGPTLTAQTISFGASPTITVGGTGIVSATANPSGLAVTFRNVDTSACTMATNGVFGQVVVTGVAPKPCTIGASQAGDAVYASAPEVLQSFSIAPANLTTPSAPAITSVVAGPGRITINFTPPTSTGGAAIASYTATCTAAGKTKSATGPGTATSLVVGGLTGGVSYTCTLTAYNGTYNSTASTTAPTIPARAVDLTPILMLLLD